MKLHVGGVRGSSVVADPHFHEFGGDTTAYLIEGDAGGVVAVDAGSGFRQLCHRLVHERAGLLVFTHYHLDHLYGLPALASAMHAGATLRIAGPARGAFSPLFALSTFLQEPFWPLTLDSALLAPICTSLDPYKGSAGLAANGLHVHWCDVAHPGGGLAYRVDEPGTGMAIVIATDMEWGACRPEQQTALRDLCTTPTPAALLIMDAPYDDAQYETRRGWGHSTWREAVALAEQCGIQRLAITHHDPAADDDALRRREASVRRRAPNASLLRQGQILELQD